MKTENANDRPKKFKDFIDLLVKRIQESDVENTSVNIAYFVTLSLFPILLVFGAVIPYFNINPSVLDQVVENVVPLPIVETIRPIINNILTLQNGGLLSIGIIAAIWAASAGMKYVRVGIVKAYGLTDSRRYMARAASAITFTIILSLLLAYMLVFGFGEALIRHWVQELALSTTIIQSFRSLKWTVPLLTLFFTFTIIYKYTPSIKHRFRDVFAGALFSTLVLVGTVQLYAVYLRLSTKLSAYGVLSAFFVLLIWIRLIGFVIILGAALNAALHEFRHGKPHRKESAVGNWIDNRIDQILAHFPFLKPDSKNKECK